MLERPNPRRRAVRHAILTEGRNVQVNGVRNPAQFIFWPFGHGGNSSSIERLKTFLFMLAISG
jgi:hypothetical protein